MENFTGLKKIERKRALQIKKLLDTTLDKEKVRRKKIKNYFLSKKGRNILIYIIAFLATIAFNIFFHIKNDYMRYKLREVTVVGHQIGSNHSLYLIVKNKKCGVFDIIVAPETYNRLKKGDKTFFNLREHDIKQTLQKNIIFFFGQIFLWMISIVIILWPIILLVLKDSR